jgi:hypothetical protein
MTSKCIGQANNHPTTMSNEVVPKASQRAAATIKHAGAAHLLPPRSKRTSCGAAPTPNPLPSSPAII